MTSNVLTMGVLLLLGTVAAEAGPEQPSEYSVSDVVITVGKGGGFGSSSYSSIQIHGSGEGISVDGTDRHRRRKTFPVDEDAFIVLLNVFYEHNFFDFKWPGKKGVSKFPNGKLHVVGFSTADSSRTTVSVEIGEYSKRLSCSDPDCPPVVRVLENAVRAFANKRLRE